MDVTIPNRSSFTCARSAADSMAGAVAWPPATTADKRRSRQSRREVVCDASCPPETGSQVEDAAHRAVSPVDHGMSFIATVRPTGQMNRAPRRNARTDLQARPLQLVFDGASCAPAGALTTGPMVPVPLTASQSNRRRARAAAAQWRSQGSTLRVRVRRHYDQFHFPTRAAPRTRPGSEPTEAHDARVPHSTKRRRAPGRCSRFAKPRAKSPLRRLLMNRAGARTSKRRKTYSSIECAA